MQRAVFSEEHIANVLHDVGFVRRSDIVQPEPPARIARYWFTYQTNDKGFKKQDGENVGFPPMSRKRHALSLGVGAAGVAVASVHLIAEEPILAAICVACYASALFARYKR